MSKALKLGVLASHGGTNLQAVIDACEEGRLDAEVRLVISNNSDSGALERAKYANIPCIHLSRKTHPEPGELDAAMAGALKANAVDLVVLAGYMRPIGSQTLKQFDGRVLNSHPALLPKFGGKGMYGSHVHKAVLEAGEKVTGVTIHLADDEYDHGPTVAQCEVPVLPGDDVDTLASRVLVYEHKFWVETLQKIAREEIILEALNKGFNKLKGMT